MLAMPASLYERIGGDVAVLAAVELFYKKVMADELTRPFFAGLDMVGQVKKQKAFMTWAFGGPAEYKGRDLREAHMPLVNRGLNDSHFDAVAKHLKATLVELEVPSAEIDEVLNIVGSTRRDVLNR
ncbi:MAG: group 1 truncated hemoglobin [Myxococcaceae bacterium]|nr:group 1 truncated hemoglobin [Myxococcaceae bacterium]